MKVELTAVRYRTFNGERHLRTFSDLPWEDMFDEHGNKLEGIRGKSGASEIGSDDLLIGADLIEMQPGSSFPLHTHPGDHILYAISGYGTVKIDGEVHRFEAGSTCYIAAERPHNVGTYPDAPGPFTLLAVGHPQKHVSDMDRMHVVEEGKL
jgi:quercetin dioxygenase-like cupin family protein